MSPAGSAYEQRLLAKLTPLLGRCSSDISYPSDSQLPPSAPVSKLEPWPVHLPRSFVFLLSWPPTALVQRSVIFRPPGVVKISIPSIRSYLAKCIKCSAFITSQGAHKSHNNHDKCRFSTKLQSTEFRTSSLEDLTFRCLRPENYRLHSEELALSNLSTRKLIVKAPPKNGLAGPSLDVIGRVVFPMTSYGLQFRAVGVGWVLAHLGLLLLDTFLHEMPTVSLDLRTL